MCSFENFPAATVKMILFLLVLSIFQIHKVIEAKEELLSVVAVFRHGEVTPTHFAPTDKYKDSSYWPTASGELTNFGKIEHIALGKWLRNRYKNFLPEIYQREDIYVRAANLSRCLKSAEANLAGLFSSSGKQVWSKKFKEMSIPIHTVPLKEDSLLEMGKVCPKYQPMYKQYLDDDMNRTNKVYMNLLAFLSNNLGEPIQSIYDIAAPYETMVTEVKYHLKQPEWTNLKVDYLRVFPESMEILTDTTYVSPTITDELARLSTGRFLDTICSHFEAVANNTKENLLASKMAMYFGDKSAICNIINTLIAYTVPASHASTLLFELWRNKTDDILYMKPYYVVNQTVRDLDIYDCRENCTLQKFLYKIDPMRMDQKVWDKDCLGKDSATVVSGAIFLSFMIALGLIYDVL